MGADSSPRERWAIATRIALISGDLDQAGEIITAACHEVSAVDVLDQVIAPALHEVGSLWELDELTIDDERLATATAHWLLSRLGALLEVAPADSRDACVVLSTVGAERHTTPLLMAEAVLHGAGYRVRTLEAGIPLDELVAAVERERPDVVGLTVTLPTSATTVRRTIDALLAARPELRILVGGGGVPTGLESEQVQQVEGMRHLHALMVAPA
jgi:methanogenic corrinoid protein MtbC1